MMHVMGTVQLSDQGRDAVRDREITATLRISPAWRDLRPLRGLVAAAAAAAGVDVDDAQLVVTELAANALTHTRSATLGADLWLAGAVGRLVVCVTDAGGPTAGPVSPAAYAPGDLSGRGLALVEALSGAWGVVGDVAGRMVWARFTGPHAAGGAS